MPNPDNYITSANASEYGKKGGKISKRRSWKKKLAELQDMLKEKYNITDTDTLYFESLVLLMRKKDMKAISEYGERRFGKVTQKTENKNKINVSELPDLIIKVE